MVIQAGTEYTATQLKDMGINPDEMWSGKEIGNLVVKDTGRGTRIFETKSSGGYSAPSVSAPSGGSNLGKYSDIIASLKGSGVGDTSALDKSLSELTASTKAATDAAKQAKIEQVPIVQNIYAKLATQLEKLMQSDKASQESAKAEATGKQKQEAAISGFSTSGGFEAAQLRTTAGKYDKLITDISDKFAINAEKLALEEQKDVKTLYSEAAEAEAAGNRDIADITYKIAGLKQNQDNLLQTVATNIMNADKEDEKLYWSNLYNNAQLALKQQELELSAQKEVADQKYQQELLNIEKTKAASGGSATSQELKTIGNNVYNYNPKTGSLTPVSGVSTAKYNEQQVADFANAYARGDVKSTGIPSEIRAAAINLGEQIKSQQPSWSNLWGLLK